MLSFISNRSLGRAAVGAGLLVASVACGQEGQRRELPRIPDVIEHMEFPGGTLESFVKLLQAEGDGVFINVLYKNGAKSIEVPAIELQNVHVLTAITATLLDTPIQFHRIQTNRFGSEVNVFTGRGQSKSTAVAEAQTTEILSVGDLFMSGSSQIDDLLAVIDVAVYDEKHPDFRPEIRYHKESGLLIVRGTQTQVSTAGDVVERMSKSSLARQDRERQRKSELIEREAAVVTLKAYSDVARRQLDIEMLNLKEVMTLRDQGAANLIALYEAQSRSAEAEAAVEIAESGLRAATAQLDLIAGEDGAKKTTVSYELGAISGASGELNSVLRAIGNLQGPTIDGGRSGDEVAVIKATNEQHRVIAAVIKAMKAAASKSRD